MNGDDTCILCGRQYPLGLHVMGCLICFPCEQKLLRGPLSRVQRRRLCRLYMPGEKTCVRNGMDKRLPV